MNQYYSEMNKRVQALSDKKTKWSEIPCDVKTYIYFVVKLSMKEKTRIIKL
jgi:hypothetical protein